MLEFLKRKLWKSALVTEIYRQHGVNIEALGETIGKGELDEVIKAHYYLSGGDPVEGARNVSQLIFERWGIHLGSLATRARLELQLKELEAAEVDEDEDEDEEIEDEDDEGNDLKPPAAESSTPTAMDAVIRAVYGDHPPAKSADLERAITIAHEDLLSEQIAMSEVEQTARALFASPIPYSTHDLAVSTALAFFKNPEFKARLWDCQMPARLRVLNWLKAGKVVGPLAKSFETVLYRVYQIEGG